MDSESSTSEEMEESNSQTSSNQTCDYLNILKQIEELSNLMIEWNNPDHVSREPLDISTLEAIFEKLTTDIKNLASLENFEKNAMFCISILNTIVRVSVLNEFSNATLRKPFQLMFQVLKEALEFLILPLLDESHPLRKVIDDKTISLPMLINDIFNSILMNLVKDDLIDTCFNRLLSNEIPSNEVIDTSEVVTRSLAYDDTNNKIITIDDTPTEDDRYDFSQIFNIYMAYVSMLAFKVFLPSANEFINNYSTLVRSFIAFLNKYLANVDNCVAFISSDVMYNTFLLIWNLTDKIALIPMFVDMECVEKVLQWVGTDIFKRHIENLGRPILSIIHNLSRNKKGLIRLLAAKAFDILIDRKQIVLNQNNERLEKTYGMTLIALATNDEQSTEDKKMLFNAGESLYGRCKKAEKDPNLRDDGLHLSESLELLHRAFSNTYVLKHILDSKSHENPKPIQYFAQLLISFYGVLLDPEPDELEKRVGRYLLKILLQISSYPDYITELTNNDEFCVVIECLAKRRKQDDAKRIWCNMQQILSSKKPTKLTSSDIYVSYDRTDQEFCKKFLRVLQGRISIPIWVDYEKVEGIDDIWEHASDKIHSAKIIIVFVSTAYAESTTKFQELAYIDSIHKKVRKGERSLIIVEVEPDFTYNRRWMSNLIGTNTKISYDKSISKMVSEMLKEITVPNRSPIKCIPCQRRTIQKRTIKNDHSPDESRIALLKSVPTVDSNVHPPSTSIQKTLSNTINTSNTLFSTAEHDSYSIVTRLAPQAGSADSSTWV